MWSSLQTRVESEEKALEAYRQERYRGSARVRLDCLAFEKGFGRLMDDGRNVVRLEQILELQGCLRVQPDYHVPVLVDAGDWGRDIKMSPSNNELLPELIVPLNVSLRAQGHESLIVAAQKMLIGDSRWWVVDVYVEDRNQPPNTQSLHSNLVRSLQEHFCNERRPPDGLIYERIRFYEGHLSHPRDDNAARAWWAALRHDPRSKKHKYLQAFFRHGSLPQAFDALLPIPGLWARMQIGVLHTMIALRCDEPILSYLEGIREMWVEQIFGGDAALAIHADAETVQALESRVPNISARDRAFVETKMNNHALFRSIDNPETRGIIWERLKLIDTPILSLRTFFQDLRYLGVARKAMQALVPLLGEPDSTNKVTIDEALGGQYRTNASASLRESSLHTQQALHEVWRFGFQYGLELTGAPRRLPHKGVRPRDSLPAWDPPTSVDQSGLWRHFFWLADQEGFQIPQLAGFELYSMSLPTPQSREGLEGTDEDEPIRRRCGIPYVYTVGMDRLALATDRVWAPWDSEYITAEFVRRSQFQAFFRYLREAVQHNPTRSTPGDTTAADEAAMADEAEVADEAGVDDEAGLADHDMTEQPGDDLDRSTSLPPISGPSPDWSDEFFDFNAASLRFPLEPPHMPAVDLKVNIVIPGRQTKTLVLQNDVALFHKFFEGLELRNFNFHTNNGTNDRTISSDQIYHFHYEVPFTALEARLGQSVQQDPATEANTRKRRLREVPVTELFASLDDIAEWIDKQVDGQQIRYLVEAEGEEQL